MKKYKKPVVCNYKMSENLVPAAVGLSVGGAFAVGAAMGLASKGDVQGINNKCNNIKKVTNL